MGIIDITGGKLEACNIYPKFHSHQDQAADQLKDLLAKYRYIMLLA